MSLDIKYRPSVYADVLGQENIITVLRNFVKEGRGFQQSYLFCGAHGSGKTTLGRILARALLCSHHVEGEPCGQCSSCRSLLQDGSSADFVEVDAATNSGKADVLRITEEIQYATFSGNRRIYLFDEAHQLSKDALDALLKPLEDTFPGSDDKQLVCIFCTTEPERMRATVLSRCAPAFVITPQTPHTIATRLQAVCAAEGIEADFEPLVLIAEITQCHIRDAMKALEGVSMLGPVNRENVAAYLHLDLNVAYVDALECIGHDLPAALQAIETILKKNGPTTCYERLAEVAMLAFRASHGLPVPSFWNKDRLRALGQSRGDALLAYAERFASRPGRPSAAMLQMDLAALHYGGSLQTRVALPSPPPAKAAQPPVPQVQPRPVSTPSSAPSSVKMISDLSGIVPDRDALWVSQQRGPAANHKGRAGAKDHSTMTHEAFSALLFQKMQEWTLGST